eukprot:1152071-Pelagomonas_calceolata.AAC.1
MTVLLFVESDDNYKLQVQFPYTFDKRLPLGPIEDDAIKMKCIPGMPGAWCTMCNQPASHDTVFSSQPTRISQSVIQSCHGLITASQPESASQSFSHAMV